jgi:hypothetical protein
LQFNWLCQVGNTNLNRPLFLKAKAFLSLEFSVAELF